VTYVMEALRSLILVDLRWETILLGFLVVAVAGAIMEEASLVKHSVPLRQEGPAQPTGWAVLVRS